MLSVIDSPHFHSISLGHLPVSTMVTTRFITMLSAVSHVHGVLLLVWSGFVSSSPDPEPGHRQPTAGGVFPFGRIDV